MKAYTDLEQSKKLAEILSIESADMYYYTANGDLYKTPNVIESKDDLDVDENSIPCWSFAALFDVLPKFIGDYGKCLYYDVDGCYCGYMDDGNFMLTIQETKADNSVDACYEMIIKLHELSLL